MPLCALRGPPQASKALQECRKSLDTFRSCRPPRCRQVGKTFPRVGKTPEVLSFPDKLDLLAKVLVKQYCYVGYATHLLVGSICREQHCAAWASPRSLPRWRPSGYSGPRATSAIPRLAAPACSLTFRPAAISAALNGARALALASSTDIPRCTL